MDVPPDLGSALADRYTLVRELGRGGMATVYVARDLRHNREIALKVLSAELGPRLTERFTREIELTARLSHPNILPLLDSGRVGDSAFYVMPLVGASLHSLLERTGPLPIEQAVRIAIEVADALDYSHRSGVVHRDIKPDNILLHQERAMVADFGIARVRDESAAQLTATGVSIGTPTYMSPEQVSGERVIDGRADVYALGCVLFEMLTGTPPYAGPSPRAIMARHMNEPPPRARTLRATIPPALDAIMQRAMAKVPADRFASAGDMRDALAASLAQGASMSRPRRRAAVAAAVVAASVVAVAIVTVAIARRDRSGTVQAGGVRPALPDSARIAVLPMSNLGSDTSDNYFAAGMTDELISTLSEVQGVRVIARSAVTRYASTTRSLPDIARELGVGSIIESSIRKDGRRLRIGVRLVDAATQEQRWSQQYDRELTDMFAIQQDVARRVAQALSVRLAATEAHALASLPTRSAEALDLYVRAKGLTNGARTLSREEMEQNAALLRRAVTLDSGFALAHAALGQRYTSILFFYSPGDEYRRLALQEIERALAIDPDLAEAYQARSDLEYTKEGGWQLEAALRDLQKAVALKPSLATAHGKLGILLMHFGIYEPAMHEIRASVALDPFDDVPRLRVGRVLWQSQRFDSALKAFERGPDIVAEHALVLGYLARAREGLAFLDSAPREPNTNGGDRGAARAVLYARLGRRADAEREMRIGATTGRELAHFHHAAFALATASVLLDRPHDAVRWLRVVTSSGMPAYELLVGDPVIARLRGNAEYESLMRAEHERYDRFRAMLARE
jgi:TolB-like protein